MTAKQPQAGEWWEKDDTRVCIVGTKKNGLTVGETECGNLISFMSIHDWQHLPDCDSFEWQPAADLPPVQPQPKRVPVRLYWYDGNIVGRYDHSQPTDPSFQEIKHDGYKFYVEVQQ